MTHPNRLVNIQALRGVAALGVLAAHLAVIERRYGDGALTPDWFDLGLAGVDLFFVISGFVMVYVTRDLVASRCAIFSFLYKRATRIYPLYWAVSLAVLAVFLVRPDFVNSSQGNQADIVASFLLIPQRQYPLLLVGWTLVHEVYFYLVFALLLAAPRKWRPPLLALWGALALVGYALGASRLGAWAALAVNPLTLEFLMGCAVGLLFLRGARTAGRLALAAGGLICLGVLGLRMGGLAPFSSDALRTALFGPAFALILYGAVAIETTGRFSAPRWAQRLGDASYSLYLTHLLTLSALGRIWALIAAPGRWDNAIVLPLIAGAAIAGAYLTYLLVERPLFARARKAGPLIGDFVSRRLGRANRA